MCVIADLKKISTNARTELLSPQRIQKDATVKIPSLENCIKGLTREVNLFCLFDKKLSDCASVSYV